jgi:NTP pyrophosphatase (non-canonical NTP hydrolase)
MFDKAMQKALADDGAKLAQLTGEDHGPHFIYDEIEVAEKWNNYQTFVNETAIFKANLGIIYCALKLTGECGEVSDKIQHRIVTWHGAFNDDFFRNVLAPDSRHQVVLELGDVLWYTTALASQLGFNIGDLYEQCGYGNDAPKGMEIVIETLRLTAHAGLLAEIVGKFVRDRDLGFAPEAYRYADDGNTAARIADKLREVLGALDVLSHGMGVDIFKVIDANVEKLESRRDRGVLQGEGDNR